VTLFPFQEYWTFYAGFTALVLVMLSLDLGVFHRKAHVVTFREATIRTVVWIVLALIFNYLFYLYAANSFANNPRLLAVPGFDPQAAARQAGLEFLTGYIVERALAFDNLFVFVVVFTFFGISSAHQHRVLVFGILGALAFRAVFIAMGSMLMAYEIVVVVFGGFLVLTGVKMFFAPDKPIEPDRNPLIRLFTRFVPVTPTLHGQQFFARVNGRLHATPLLVALLFVELSDIVFAVDSVPAIFALTREPLIVFTSNIFAVLGLRAMYFMLTGAVDKFHLLKYGLATVLVFVGLKMVWLNHWFGGKFPITWSLGIIVGVILASILASLLWPPRQEPLPRPVQPIETE
jgi:tellurite resistance protein TerC